MENYEEKKKELEEQLKRLEEDYRESLAVEVLKLLKENVFNKYEFYHSPREITLPLIVINDINVSDDLCKLISDNVITIENDLKICLDCGSLVISFKNIDDIYQFVIDNNIKINIEDLTLQIRNTGLEYDKLRRIKGVHTGLPILCPFPHDCNQYGKCHKSDCNADECTNGMAFRRS